VPRFQMGRLTTVRVGLAMILIPAVWAGGWAWWYFTRNWMPVAMPVSLAAGHIRTPEFRVNVAGFYSIVMGTRGPEFENIPCPEGSGQCQGSVALLKASWSVSRSGKVVATGKSDKLVPLYTLAVRDLGGFHATKGSYVLDVEILQDESRINSEQPYLDVYENGGASSETADQIVLGLVALLLFVPIGICAFVISGINHRQEKSAALLRRFPLTLPGPLPGEPSPRPQRAVLHRPRYPLLRRRSSQPLRASLSTTPLTILITFELVFIAWYVFRSLKYPIVGLPLRLVRPDAYAQPGPGIQPLVVRVAPGPDGRPSPYVNWQPVAWENLTAVLQKELSQRPPAWPVYVEGDPNLEWKVVARAIDEVRSLQAQVVLIKDERAPVR